MATSKQKAFCVLQFSKIESAITVQRAFRTKFGCQPPNDNNILSEPNNFIWLQDGAPHHWHLSVRNWLNITVPNQWIGHKEPPDKACIALPPRSPDLTPWDFYLWGLIKDYVYVPPLPSDISDLRHRMEADVARISSDTLKKVWDELTCRLDLCRVMNGAHIEHL
ncbi:DUF4817 domain-containing protein [Trichonephila clavipes]|nr:DUF4817 domain-containing protein [Trichonephila clavipes]